jgi:N-acetylglutamate synthase-like GNAT family acetyltransferase
LQICFDKAKEEKLPLVVCSEPAANDFFASLGFKETEHADIDLAQFAPSIVALGCLG